MQSSLFTSCRRSTSPLLTNNYILPSLTLRKPSIVCLETSCGGTCGASVWTNGQMSSMACTTMPGAMYGSMVSTVRSLAWEFVCIRALSLAHCRTSSGLVCHGSFSMLMTWCSLQTPRMSVPRSSRHGRLAWKAKGSFWTKFMVSGVDLDVLQKSGKYPCAVCCKGVCNNSIECFQCKLRVHKRCSSITGRLVNVRNYICPRCKGNPRPTNDPSGCRRQRVDVEDTFCFLGDTLCSGGGCTSANASRCCVAWGKLRKLLPVLTSRHLSP